MISDPTKILTLANIISLGRAILAVPIIFTLRDTSLGSITFVLILIAVLSDALDGWVARKAHEVTHFGKWIDPIADFVCIFAVVAYLTLIDRFPSWFFLHQQRRQHRPQNRNPCIETPTNPKLPAPWSPTAPTKKTPKATTSTKNATTQKKTTPQTKSEKNYTPVAK